MFPVGASSLWSWWWTTNNKSDETSRNILTTLVLLLTILCFVFLTKKRNHQNPPPPPPPPGPRGLPLIGYLPFLNPNLHHGFKDLANKYGPIFRIWLGKQECIVISSPSLVKQVVKEQDAIFANRVPNIAAKSLLFGSVDIAFTDYNDEWRKMRKIFASEMLSRSSLDASYSLRKQHVNKMLKETYEASTSKGVVDIGEVVFGTLMSSIMSMVWGDALEGDDKGYSVVNSEFRSNVNKQLELLGTPNVSDLFPMLAWFDLQGIAREMKRISRRSGQIFDLAINHCVNGVDNEQNYLLGYLLKLTKGEDPTRSLTLPQVKAMLMDVIIGGTDTSISMVEWAMAEILQHPKVLEKVQKELREMVGLNTRVEESDIAKLKYLNAVIKEVFRLHPPLPLLVPHSPSKASTIGGYSISKGASIFLNIYTIHRDPQLWEDPLLFKPERFLNGSSAGEIDYLGNHFQFLPFGSGRRICAGIPLAERMSILVLASLLHGFQWELPKGVTRVDLSEKFGIVVKKQKPLLLVPTPRLSSFELYS
ncbi:unnamed protein product [Amaranthus hypochondriacus]